MLAGRQWGTQGRMPFVVPALALQVGWWQRCPVSVPMAPAAAGGRSWHQAAAAWAGIVVPQPACLGAKILQAH